MHAGCILWHQLFPALLIYCRHIHMYVYVDIIYVCIYISISLFFLLVVKQYEDPRLCMKWSQHNAKSKVSPTTQVAPGHVGICLAVVPLTPAILSSSAVNTELGIIDLHHKWIVLNPLRNFCHRLLTNMPHMHNLVFL